MTSSDFDAGTDLELSRQRFEASWSDLRTALRRETGWFPKGLGWTLLIVAAAGGVAAAAAIGSRRERSRLTR